MDRHRAADNLAAAGELLRTERHRSSVSRSYYSAFAGLALRLTRAGVTFATDREAPPHGDKLRDLVKNNLPDLSGPARRDVRHLIKVLYDLRLLADYRRSAVIGEREAVEARVQAQVILKRLKVAV